MLTLAQCLHSSEDPVQLQCVLPAGGDRRLRVGVQRDAAGEGEQPTFTTVRFCRATGSTGSCPVTLWICVSLTGERWHGNILAGGEEDVSGLQGCQPRCQDDQTRHHGDGDGDGDGERTRAVFIHAGVPEPRLPPGPELIPNSDIWSVQLSSVFVTVKMCSVLHYLFNYVLLIHRTTRSLQLKHINFLFYK